MADVLDERPSFQPPVGNREIPTWALDAFRRIAQVLDANRYENTFQPQHTEPDSVWDGRMVFADGTDWDPGRGRGIYYYDSIVTNDWVFVGGGVTNLDIALGLVDGRSSVNKFGHATDADSGLAADIWDGSRATGKITPWVAPTQARIHDIVSTSANDTAAGTGAQEVTIWGLTAWGTKEVSEVIVMNGTTNVPTSNAYVIIHRMSVTDKGAADTNVGDISATAQTDSTTTALILASEGQTQMAIYGVPTGAKLVVYDYFASVIGNASAKGTVRLKWNPNPDEELLQFVTKHILETQFDHYFDPPVVLTGPGILKLEVTTNANNCEVSGGFDCVLIDAPT